MSGLVYRREIDGLRAVAVGAVLVYHAEFEGPGGMLLRGGFLGVDIFFVISGYLISALLLRELEATGRVSIAGFYERRIRRIIPALLVVMATALPFAWFALLPPEFVSFCWSILYSLGFASNYYFHYAGLEYGATDSHFLPFLHTWSLSVEEQFYLVFPLLLLLCHRLLRRHLLVVLLVAIVGSLVASQWLSARMPSVNFYLLGSRSWELLCGAVLAMLEVRAVRDPLPGAIARLAPAAGLACIAGAMWLFDGNTRHPSLLTAIPVAGTCALIRYGGGPDAVSRLLASRPFRAVGLISYSLYLWHYPVFAMERIKLAETTNLDRALWIGASLVLATATYFLVERPFRDRRRTGRLRLFAILLPVAAVVGFASHRVIVAEGFPDRVSKVLVRNLIDERFFPDTHDTYRKCHKLFNAKKDAFCILNPEQPRRAYLVGDSHMGAVMFDLAERIRGAGYSLTTMTSAGAYFMRSRPDADAFERKRYRELMAAQASIVVIGGFYHRTEKPALSVPGFDGNFRDAVAALQRNGNDVVLVYPVPDYPRSVVELLFRNRGEKVLSGGDSLPLVTSSLESYRRRTAAITAFLDAIPGDRVHRVRPAEIFCNEGTGRCYGNDARMTYYADGDHLSWLGADMLNARIMTVVSGIRQNAAP